MSKIVLVADDTDCLYPARYQLIERLCASGHQVMIVAHAGPSAEHLVSMGCAVLSIPQGHRWSMWRACVSLMRGSSSPDLVIAIGFSPLWRVIFCFAWLRKPLFLMLDRWPVCLDTSFSWCYGTVLRWVMRAYRMVILSDHALALRCESWRLFSEQHAAVVEGDGVFVTTLPELIVEKRTPFSFLLVIDDPACSIREYLLAVRALRKKYPKSMLSFDVIFSMTASDQASFLSRVPVEFQHYLTCHPCPSFAEWPVFMESIHVVVVLGDRGGYPRVAWQAVSFGKPLIAPSMSFFSAYLDESDQGGLFFEYGNAQSLAETMHALFVCEPFARRQKGQWLAARIAERCDDRRVTRRYREVFRTVMGTRFME